MFLSNLRDPDFFLSVCLPVIGAFTLKTTKKTAEQTQKQTKKTQEASNEKQFRLKH